ncbi:hypothetical protein BUALT_Bualt03G0130300 [Buddleja alternifolia]|uniref:Uncharacterized protein n=1 Tax=Buddleja alternifolia TaxID=168488 RepID=A0AAV6XUH7_9LAMI|nr:hypothetical protein BUALT_Bualt03G0130300 [Buddleja alternifolia]
MSRRAGGVYQEGPTLGAHCGQEGRHELVHCPADCRKFGAIPLGECLGTKCSTVRRSNVYAKKLVGKMRNGSSSRLGMEVGWSRVWGILDAARAKKNSAARLKRVGP